MWHKAIGINNYSKAPKYVTIDNLMLSFRLYYLTITPCTDSIKKDKEKSYN